MFYTKLGRVAAGLAFVLGIIGIGIGSSISVEEGLTADGFKLAEVFLENGFTCILFAIIVGVLTDISQSLTKSDKG
jgi:hypothetical protein